MIDPHERLEGRIRRLIRGNSERGDTIPMQPYWPYNASRVRTISDGVEGRLEVGMGSFATRLGRIARRGELASWVTDRNVEPPVTHLLLQTAIGAYVVEGFDRNEQSGPLHHVLSERGVEIVRTMHDLLDKFEPPVASNANRLLLDPSSVVVTGI